MHVTVHRVYRHCKRVCSESWLWEKNPLSHWGIEPASVVCQSNALINWATSHPRHLQIAISAQTVGFVLYACITGTRGRVYLYLYNRYNRDTFCFSVVESKSRYSCSPSQLCIWLFVRPLLTAMSQECSHLCLLSLLEENLPWTCPLLSNFLYRSLLHT